MYPGIQVETEPIFVRDGNIWTSAGVTAGIDLALAMVADDIGRDNALKLARRLVAYMIRPGGQSQFSEMLQFQSKASQGRFEPLANWVSANMRRCAIPTLKPHKTPFLAIFEQCRYVQFVLR